jgi:hypothetical protein
MGEIDILLIAPTVTAIGALHAAWQTHLIRNRTNFPAVILAALAAAIAMLAKGPPALLPIALAGYGGIALHQAWATPTRRGLWPVAALIGLGTAGASAWLNRAERLDLSAIGGLLLLAALVTPAAATLLRLATPARAVPTLRTFAHTHPIVVLGLPFLVLWGWSKLVEARIGPDAVAAAITTETSDNLRVLVPESSLNNFEALAYGAGLGSITAAAGALWVWRSRRRLTPEMSLLIAWSLGGLIAFTILGKGVPRYLTPLWPALSMLGGAWFAAGLPTVRSPRRLAGWAYALVIGLALGQSWWYGWERERLYADRCPRAMLAELFAQPGVDPSRLSMFEFETPAVDFYAGRPIDALADVEPRPGLVGVGPRTIADLREQLVREGPSASWALLIRQTQPEDQVPIPAADRLRGAGLAVEEVPIKARFTIDNRRTQVIAARVRAAEN